MSADLIIPKKRKKVKLWIHPEGRVVGSLFVRAATEDAPEQRIAESLNEEQPFVVLEREDPDELRFYHQTSILRVEAEADPQPEGGADLIHHRCQLGMMDGSFIEGTLAGTSPPDRARLFDFLNREKERFLEVFLDDGTVLAVNKSYVIFVRPTEEE